MIYAYIAVTNSRCAPTNLNVQTRHLIDWIESEWFCLGCSLATDELVGYQTLQNFQPATEVLRGDEVAQVPSQLLMIVMVEAFDSGV